MKKILLMLLSFSVFFLLTSTVSAITGGTRTPHVYVYYYTVPEVATGYINLINGNEYPATITITPSDNIAGMIEFSENPFVMAPGEERYVPFDVTVDQQLTWNGQFNVNFYVPQDNIQNWPLSIDVTISKGTCSDGDTRFCMIDGCAGTQVCSDNSFGPCIKNDPNCGLEGCVEAWTCTPWSECQPDNTKTRTCTDMNDCGTELNKPSEIQSCIYDSGMECDCEDIMSRLEELESKTQTLEDDVSALQVLVDSLQTLIDSIQSSITSIQNSIANIQSSISAILARLTALETYEPVPEGCAYANPPCEEGYQCIDNECILIEEGCIESWSCTEWGECINNEQTRTCYDLNECGTEIFKPEETQACESDDDDFTVIFRTNVPGEDYVFKSIGSWIVVDCNQDGVLESFGGVGISRTGRVRNPIGTTPGGHPYECFSSNTEVRINTGSRDIIYLASRVPDETPVLSTSPTEPYASNNQEVYQ